MTKTEKAVTWAIEIANDPAHGYDQDNRWGPDYDCSSLVISAWQQAGVPVKTKGATYTGNMKSVFLSCGFKDVTSKVNLSTGSGMKRGDVLLNIASIFQSCFGEAAFEFFADPQETSSIVGQQIWFPVIYGKISP